MEAVRFHLHHRHLHSHPPIPLEMAEVPHENEAAG